MDFEIKSRKKKISNILFELEINHQFVETEDGVMEDFHAIYNKIYTNQVSFKTNYFSFYIISQ